MFRLTITLVLLATAMPTPASAGFIEDWYLAVVFSPGNADIESVRFSQPVLPFLDSHSIDLLGSTATAAYDFDGGATGGRFDITTNIRLLALPGVNRRMTTAGFIYINSPVPLLISGTSQIDYDLPRHPMFTIAGLGISTEDGIGVVVADADLYSTTTSGPRMGTLAAEFTDVLLPANETFVMQYSFVIDTSGDVSTTALATGVGTAHFEVAAIPEPTTLWLGAMAVSPLILRRPKRRR
ncbi:MAG TPA: hypothetical protein P5081_09565 [Phycisphaerae bacterium]|nr:hypothetical protein [Phycisphaerae bacterium]HRW53123.1 hypothetical protein [Phycisphaerae bacterium]